MPKRCREAERPERWTPGTHEAKCQRHQSHFACHMICMYDTDAYKILQVQCSIHRNRTITIHPIAYCISLQRYAMYFNVLKPKVVSWQILPCREAGHREASRTSAMVVLFLKYTWPSDRLRKTVLNRFSSDFRLAHRKIIQTLSTINGCQHWHHQSP